MFFVLTLERYPKGLGTSSSLTGNLFDFVSTGFNDLEFVSFVFSIYFDHSMSIVSYRNHFSSEPALLGVQHVNLFVLLYGISVQLDWLHSEGELGFVSVGFGCYALFDGTHWLLVQAFLDHHAELASVSFNVAFLEGCSTHVGELALDRVAEDVAFLGGASAHTGGLLDIVYFDPYEYVRERVLTGDGLLLGRCLDTELRLVFLVFLLCLVLRIGAPVAHHFEGSSVESRRLNL